MSEYVVGQEVTITLTCKDAQGVLKDPAAINLEILHPDKVTKDTKTIADLDHVSTGLYTYTLVPNVVGRWRYYGNATGGITIASKGHFLALEKGT